MKMTKMLFLGLSLVLTIGLQAQTKEPAPKAAPAAVEAPPQMRAQPKAERAQQAKAQRDALVAKLDLSAEQATQFDAINQNYREQMRELRQNNSTDRRAVGQQMRALRDAQQEEIRGILTPKQVEIYDAELEAARTSRRAPKGKRR